MAENRSFSAPVGFKTIQIGGGLRPPTFLDGFKATRGRLDPENDPCSAKSETPAKLPRNGQKCFIELRDESAHCLHHPVIPGAERDHLIWVPEGSLAGFFGCHEIALELICGAGFAWKLMCGAGPGDLGGSRGSAGPGSYLLSDWIAYTWGFQYMIF